MIYFFLIIRKRVNIRGRTNRIQKFYTSYSIARLFIGFMSCFSLFWQGYILTSMRKSSHCSESFFSLQWVFFLIEVRMLENVYFPDNVSFLHIIFRQYPELLLKATGKVRRIIESYNETNLIDPVFTPSVICKTFFIKNTPSRLKGLFT